MEEREQLDTSTDESARVSQRHLGDTGTRSAAWRPLRLLMFRNLLIADLVSDMGTFMQGVGAAWLMVSEGAGPLLVALTQTASALPFFLLALPAGALGDIFDRRKLVIATEVWMALVAAVLAALLRVTRRRWPHHNVYLRRHESAHADHLSRLDQLQLYLRHSRATQPVVSN